MKLEQKILINQYGQDLVHIDILVSLFTEMDKNLQKAFFVDFLDLIQQSKPRDEDIEVAIIESKLKPTYTPCIMLKKGVANHNLQKIINLPENELRKVFILFLSLFKIAYSRRFKEEKNNPDKWWYWDLSDNRNINAIMSCSEIPFINNGW
jgi:hypothetical protein